MNTERRLFERTIQGRQSLIKANLKDDKFQVCSMNTKIKLKKSHLSDSGNVWITLRDSPNLNIFMWDQPLGNNTKFSR